jgi:phage terminase small subunit
MIVELGGRTIELTDEQLSRFDALTKLQRSVVLAHIANKPIDVAHRDAGGTSRDESRRITLAGEILRNPATAAFVDSMRVDVAPDIASAVASRDEILRDLTEIAQTTINDVVTFSERPLIDMENGMTVLTSTIHVRSMSEMPPNAMKAIKSVKQTKHGIELTLHDTVAVRKQISDMCGYDAPKKTELSGPNGQPLQIQEVPDEELETKLKSLGLGRYHNQLSNKRVK